MIKNKRVSACLIARNEEDNIEDCIKSIYEIVDEIIVLDTGSTDKTKEIAKSFNKVKLFETKWKYDFSIARNECISYASGDWILSIDGDEVLEKSKTDLQILETKTNFNAFFFKIICPYPDSNLKKAYLRHSLFKNKIGIKYVKAIHEHLASDILKDFIIEDINIFNYKNFKSKEEIELKEQQYFNLITKSIKETDNLIDKAHYIKHLSEFYTEYGDHENSLLASHTLYKIYNKIDFLKNSKEYEFVLQDIYKGEFLYNKNINHAEKFVNEHIKINKSSFSANFFKANITKERGDKKKALEMYLKCENLLNKKEINYEIILENLNKMKDSVLK